jgi:MFS transporter, DHA1 family, quinolone resistance protein
MAVSVPQSERALNLRYISLVALQEFAILLPLSVLVIHMTDRGLSLGVIGVTFAIRSLIVVILEIPTGGLADALGRKPIALWSQGFTLASMVVLLFITDATVALLYALLQGIGAALHSGALGAWYVDNLKRVNPHTDLQQNLARVEFVRSACMIGTFLGGLLPTLAAPYNLPWPLSNFGISLFAGIILRLIVWLLTAVLITEPEFHGKTAVAGFKAVPEVLRNASRLSRQNRVVRYLLISACASGFGLASIDTFWQPIAGLIYGTNPESGAVFGLFGMLTGIGVTLGSFLVMRFGSKFPGGAPALAAFSQLFKGCSLMIVATVLTGLGLGSGLLLTFVFIAANNIPHDTLLHKSVPDSLRSIILSLESLAIFLGLTLGSSLLGILASRTTPMLAVMAAALVVVSGSLIYILIHKEQLRQLKETTTGLS